MLRFCHDNEINSWPIQCANWCARYVSPVWSDTCSLISFIFASVTFYNGSWALRRNPPQFLRDKILRCTTSHAPPSIFSATFFGGPCPSPPLLQSRSASAQGVRLFVTLSRYNLITSDKQSVFHRRVDFFCEWFYNNYNKVSFRYVNLNWHICWNSAELWVSVNLIKRLTLCSSGWPGNIVSDHFRSFCGIILVHL